MIYSYINTRENWKNSKLCENTPPCGRRVSTQFLVFPISTRVDITVYQHEKCFIFLKYHLEGSYTQTNTRQSILLVVSTCQQVTINLSILSSCNKSVKIRVIATCRLQTCYNLFKQLAANLWITNCDNQLATSLLTTCKQSNRLVVNKLSQAMRTHPNVGLLITSL